MVKELRVYGWQRRKQGKPRDADGLALSLVFPQLSTAAMGRAGTYFDS